MVRLGDKVRDAITGFEGVVIGITYWINGCVRCGVRPTALKDGVPMGDQWIDVEHLEVVEAQTLPEPAAAAGGPQKDPRQPVGG